MSERRLFRTKTVEKAKQARAGSVLILDKLKHVFPSRNETCESRCSSKRSQLQIDTQHQKMKKLMQKLAVSTKYSNFNISEQESSGKSSCSPLTSSFLRSRKNLSNQPILSTRRHNNRKILNKKEINVDRIFINEQADSSSFIKCAQTKRSQRNRSYLLQSHKLQPGIINQMVA